MNRGDSFEIVLNIVVNGSAITEGQFDDIEFTINKESYTSCIQKTLSDGTIKWSEAQGKYYVLLTQDDTFAMQTTNTWQIRLYDLVGEEKKVISNDNKGTIILGDVNSKEVLG